MSHLQQLGSGPAFSCAAHAEEATGLGWKIAGSDCSSSSSAWTLHLRARAAWARGSGGSEEETGSALLEAAALLK